MLTRTEHSRAPNAPAAAPRLSACRDWLPEGMRGAVCFSVDDVHPATSSDEYEAGGDLARGALGRLEDLLDRHPKLRATLFVTPDWRLQHLVPTRKWLTRIPGLRDRVHWAPRRRRGHFRVDRFPAFVAYLNGVRNAEVAVHGLTHTHPGAHMAVEFQQQDCRTCRALLCAATEIFVAARLRYVPGFQAPAWNAPPALCEALREEGFRFLCSARDLRTAVDAKARTAMSGLEGASLIAPTWIMPGRAGCRRAVDSEAVPPSNECALVHITTNFQASSTIERAIRIIDAGGLLSIKAHIFKSGGGHTMADGLDDAYINYLDMVFRELERRYGESLWWTSLSEAADRCTTAAR
jgi:peptidoglycan/xylan/chitin deacetylase (PgdA/CDA1 family)